jgi:hypothetical protein
VSWRATTNLIVLIIAPPDFVRAEGTSIKVTPHPFLAVSAPWVALALLTRPTRPISGKDWERTESRLGAGAGAAEAILGIAIVPKVPRKLQGHSIAQKHSRVCIVPKAPKAQRRRDHS